MNLPKVIYNGDVVTWTITDSTHTAEYWTTCSVYLQASGSTAQRFTASAIDNASFAVTASVSGSVTGSFSAYYVFEESPLCETVFAGTVEIRSNPSGSAYDPRSHARKVLDAIEAVLEGRASVDQVSITINGRTLSRTPLADLLKLRGTYRDEVANEEVALRISQGLGSGRKVLVRFN
jgi:hypothetical protein